jgi:potassium channel LctB
VRLLEGMGYRRVRDYEPGTEGWLELGGEAESTEHLPDVSVLPQESTLRPGYATKVAPEGRFKLRMMALLDRTSFSALGLVWFAVVLGFSFMYWVLGFWGSACLIDAGVPCDTSIESLGTALYFSFVTATSVGFGDVVPIGPARLLAVIEGGMALLIFGVLVSKLVSHKQEQLTEEIHLIAFEDRLGRVRTNLHMVLSELLQLSAECIDHGCLPERMLPRVESASSVFAGELQAVHDLLYRPQKNPEESMLEGILAAQVAILDAMAELLGKMPDSTERTAVLSRSLTTIRGLSSEICGECVPREYAPELKFWMDRVQGLAERVRLPDGKAV